MLSWTSTRTLCLASMACRSRALATRRFRVEPYRRSPIGMAFRMAQHVTGTRRVHSRESHSSGRTCFTVSFESWARMELCFLNRVTSTASSSLPCNAMCRATSLKRSRSTDRARTLHCSKGVDARRRGQRNPSTVASRVPSSADLPISRTLRIRGTRQNVSTDHPRQNVEPSCVETAHRTAPLRSSDMASATYRSTALERSRWPERAVVSAAGAGEEGGHDVGGVSVEHRQG
jgi:hypothetical protein